jgi:hypothetical protein
LAYRNGECRFIGQFPFYFTGISFGTNFNSPSMTGTLNIQNNMLLRTGSAHRDYGYQIGAIWAYWLNNSGKAQNLNVTVSGNTIQDSTYSGIFIEEPALNISVTYASNNIINAGTYGVYIQGSATGTSLFNSNTVNGAPSGKFLNTSTGFTVSGAGITGVGGKRKSLQDRRGKDYSK